MRHVLADARTGKKLPGIYTPRLASAEPEPGERGLKAYFKPNEDKTSHIEGVWYLYVPGSYESPTGEYTMVGFMQEPDPWDDL